MRLIKGGKADESKPEGLDRLTADISPETYVLWKGVKISVDNRLLDIHMLHRARAAALGPFHLRTIDE